jgi:hypothetical protein
MGSTEHREFSVSRTLTGLTKISQEIFENTRALVCMQAAKIRKTGSDEKVYSTALWCGFSAIPITDSPLKPITHSPAIPISVLP